MRTDGSPYDSIEFEVALQLVYEYPFSIAPSTHVVSTEFPCRSSDTNHSSSK